MSSKIKNTVIIGVLALSVTLILWVTLFSRLGSESRHFYPPFWSYRAILNGSRKDLYEVIGNIILFVPIGIVSVLVLRLNITRTILLGIAISLLIESCQWFLWLGSFEIDDVLHNTIGAAIGAAFVRKTMVGKQLISITHDGKKNAVLLFGSISIMILIVLGYRSFKVQTMVRYAIMNDRDDGAKNLLILSPYPRYIGETDFNVSYNDDGSVTIEGSSDNRAWIEIGKVKLPSGFYSFSGLSNVPDKTVAIELEYFDEEQEKYVRLTQDVGSIEEVKFELDNPTKLRALIGIYSGAKGKYVITPVIYEEED